ncbi:hypothetical protein EON65_24900 [archaeon]|nr:MAG: hypothetical protein EON65_24900 [archaeon]
MLLLPLAICIALMLIVAYSDRNKAAYPDNIDLSASIIDDKPDEAAWLWNWPLWWLKDNNGDSNPTLSPTQSLSTTPTLSPIPTLTPTVKPTKHGSIPILTPTTAPHDGSRRFPSNPPSWMDGNMPSLVPTCEVQERRKRLAEAEEGL